MKNTKRIVVLVSGSGSNLQSILDHLHLKTFVHHDGSQCGIQAEVMAVISNRPEVYALQRADKANIPAHVLDHKTFESRDAFDRELRQLIDRYQPDVVVLAGFMRILTNEFVEHFYGKLLNIHPSLLPKYPGLNTHQRAIDAGDTVAGVTVHFVTPELDGGPPIIQAQVPILNDDTPVSLAKRVLEKEHQIYPQAVAWLLDDQLMLRDNQATFTRMDATALPMVIS